MQQEKKESFWAYLFMCFLGVFGVHKFYLRQPYMGFLYMFTGGLLGLGFIYDLFTIPFQVAIANQSLELEQNILEETNTREAVPARKCCCTCNQQNT